MLEMESLFPTGNDLDREGMLERRIKTGWTLIGLFITAMVLGPFLSNLGVKVFMVPHTRDEWAREIAIVVSCANVGCWMLFPMEDAAVLRRWIRPKKIIFPRHTGAFLAMLAAVAFLLLLILGAIRSSFWFSLAGVMIYSWNFLGFAYITTQVRRAVADARPNYEAYRKPLRALALQALEVVTSYWCTDTGLVRGNWQQKRHLLLVGGFLASMYISKTYATAAYFFGTFVILCAEGSIALFRHFRDVKFDSIEEAIRALPPASKSR